MNSMISTGISNIVISQIGPVCTSTSIQQRFQRTRALLHALYMHMNSACTWTLALLTRLTGCSSHLSYPWAFSLTRLSFLVCKWESLNAVTVFKLFCGALGFRLKDMAWAHGSRATSLMRKTGEAKKAEIYKTHFNRAVQLLSVLYIRLPQKIPFEKNIVLMLKIESYWFACLISAQIALMFYMSMRKEL